MQASRHSQQRRSRLLLQILEARLDRLDAFAICKRALLDGSLQAWPPTWNMSSPAQLGLTTAATTVSPHSLSDSGGRQMLSGACQSAVIRAPHFSHAYASATGSGEDKPLSTSAEMPAARNAFNEPISPLDDEHDHGDADDPDYEASAGSDGEYEADDGSDNDDEAEMEAPFMAPSRAAKAESLEEDATLDSWNASPSLSAFFQEFKRSSSQKQKFMLKRMMAGREELFAPQRSRDEEARLQFQQEAFKANFKSQVVEIRGVSKGTRTGGIRRFSAVVVVGNGQGTLGLGSGKATELQAAVAKANMRALKTLFFVPRYCDATIYQGQVAKFGKAKVIMYPQSTGSGIRACGMVTSICNLAGIKDIGVKIHGTRNARNIAKALITAFEAQKLPGDPLPQLPAGGTSSNSMPLFQQLNRRLAASTM